MSIDTQTPASPDAVTTEQAAPEATGAAPEQTASEAAEPTPEAAAAAAEPAEAAPQQAAAVFMAAVESEAAAEPAPEASPRKRRRLWIPLALILVLAVALLAALSAGDRHFADRFLPHTEILGVDCSDLTEAEAARALVGAADALTLTLRDAGGEEIAALPLNAFLDPGKLTALAGDFFRQQADARRTLEWLRGGDWTYAARPLEELALDDVRGILNRTLYGGEAPVSSRSARLVFGENGYTLEPETQGTAANVLLCARAVTQTLRGVDSLAGPLPEAVAEGGLIRPMVTADSPELAARRQVLDDYLALPVTLDFQNGTVYTLSAEDIWSVSDFAQRGGTVECEPDLARVRALTDILADEYASQGVDAKFLHTAETRDYCYYRVGDKGWILNRDALAEDVYAALRDRRAAEIVPDYDRTWYWKDYYWYYEVGDTYVEISLDNQYMWVFVDGRVLVETPVVTGSYETWDETRRGCFKVYYKEEDLYLTGPTWHDHVDYWMPFDGGIGLHDSDWRDEYGGDIYQGDGSHGCINTPLEAIQLIYENIHVGDFVIVY